MASRRVAVLLRGVNVGRAKRISSAQLVSIVEATGATDVRTLLNSGNAVCTSSRTPASLATAVAGGIEATLGFSSATVVRTRAELDAVIELDPLGDVAVDPSRYLVMFLDGTPDPARVSALRSVEVGDEQWVVEGRELYAWLPAGVADSLLFKALTKNPLGVVGTARNWSTVTKLRDLL
jgi:uncharacterized protein (DUF1697 family)